MRKIRLRRRALASLAVGVVVTIGGSPSAHAALGNPQRVSLAPDGSEFAGASSGVISADGSTVAWVTSSGTEDQNTDVYARKLATGDTERVSVNPAGYLVDAVSQDVGISASGRYVVFHSDSSGLVPGDDNAANDVFVRDLELGTTTLASSTSDGSAAGGVLGSISADGRYVAFNSLSSRLVPDDTNDAWDVFVKDLQTGAVTRASVDGDGRQVSDPACWHTCAGMYPRISANGRYVVFESRGHLDPAHAAGGIFVKDLQTGATTLVSVGSDGQPGRPGSYGPMAWISADGTVVAFLSSSEGLVPNDTNNLTDAFVHDLSSGETVRASVTDTGAESNADTNWVSLSPDGSRVGFATWADNIVSGDTNGWEEGFVFERSTGAVTRVTIAADGSEGNDISSAPTFSSDNARIAFDSAASNLVTGDTNGMFDVFVRDMSGGSDPRESAQKFVQEIRASEPSERAWVPRDDLGRSRRP